MGEGIGRGAMRTPASLCVSRKNRADPARAHEPRGWLVVVVVIVGNGKHPTPYTLVLELELGKKINGESVIGKWEWGPGGGRRGRGEVR
jgi:hypothetical protein